MLSRERGNYFSNFHLPSFIWLPPILEQRGEEVSVLYGRSACSAYRRCWIRRLYTCVYVSTQIIYVFGVQTILYTEIGASRKNFTAVKTVDVCAVGRVQVWEQPLKGQLLQSGASFC